MIQKNATTKTRPDTRPAAVPRRSLLPALVASGACGLAPAAASALQLGEASVQSGLGQPLRASIAFALSPNEQVYDYCIFLKPPAAGLPGIRDARVTISNGRINIRGGAPVKEPMLGLSIAVDCPYTANLTRDYTLMIDPLPVAETVEAPVSQPLPAATERPAQPAIRPTAARRTAAPASTASTPIDTVGSYRVRAGDTLSGIVSRIEDRELTLWPAVQRVFEANPDAFIDGDMNRLRAGSLLYFPSLAAGDAASASPAPAAVDIAAETVATAPAEVSPSAQTVDVTASADPAVAANAIQPGALQVETNAPAIETSPAIEPALPVSLDSATADSAVPDNSTTQSFNIEVVDAGATTARSSATAGASAWGYWIAGAGTLLVAALALFGVRLRRRPRPPVLPIASAVDSADESPTTPANALSDPAVSYGAFDGSVDANLADGSGFEPGSDVEVAEDFGFSTSRDLVTDFDLTPPDEQPEVSDDTTATDIIPLSKAEEHTILEREILPTDEDDGDEYDMSMIVDATRQRYSADSDVTAKQLHAVVVDAGAKTDTAEITVAEHTLTDEIDYQILEQDYEDELTATQALQAEIQKAADELKARIEDDESSTTMTGQATSLLDGPELGDDTDVNEAIAASGIYEGVADETTAMPTSEGDDVPVDIGEDHTAEIPNALVEARRLDETAASTDITTEMPSADNDDTADVDVETRRFKTGSTGRHG